MKSLAFVCRCALTLMFLCVMGPKPVHALLVIHSLFNKDMNDPQTGRIVLMAMDPLGTPYHRTKSKS
jgi:hypothetical protein